MTKTSKDIAVKKLLERIKEEREVNIKNGIYRRIQINFAYNSNRIEGSRLSKEQTQFIFDTNTIGFEDEQPLPIDDIIETRNHFRAVDYVLYTVNSPLTEDWIKHIHVLLKSNTSQAEKDWFVVGDYKKYPNEVGDRETTPPEAVAEAIRQLLDEYAKSSSKTVYDLIDFHVAVERIHPFQDGNGRVGRLILFKELLRYSHIPFIITDNKKYFYYRGLKEWDSERNFLYETCLSCQDDMIAILNYYGIVKAEN